MGGLLAQGAGCGQLGAGLEHALRDERQDWRALGAGRQQLVKLELAHHAQHRGYVAVGQGADYFEGLRQPRADGGVAFEDQAQGRDLFGRPVGDIGQGAIFDFAVLAEGLAQEEGGRGSAVGHDGDIHADYIAIYTQPVKSYYINYMTT